MKQPVGILGSWTYLTLNTERLPNPDLFHRSDSERANRNRLGKANHLAKLVGRPPRSSEVSPLRSLGSPNRSAELMEVLPDMFSSLVLASYWRRGEKSGQPAATRSFDFVDAHRSTSVLLSRPKNMSEEMAFAFANFCRASLDSDTAAGTSAFLLLGSLGRKERRIPRLNIQHSDLNKPGAVAVAAPLPLSDRLNAGDGDLLFRLLLLQCPGGGEGGGPSLRVPPGAESVSHCERVVLVSANSRV